MRRKYFLIVTLLFTISLFAQEEVKSKDGKIIIMNADGTWKYKQSISNDLNNKKKYSSVKIGSQTWMTENLNVDHFRNGDPIPEVKTDAEWEKASNEKQPAYCYLNNDSSNGTKLGKLYNWYAVNDKRGLAPLGWHVPSLSEFELLAKTVNDSGNALKDIGQGEDGGIGTNKTGFSAFLTGIRDSYGHFQSGGQTSFWSSTGHHVPTMAMTFCIWVLEDFCRTSGDDDQGCGNYVRCIKDVK